MAKHQHRLAVVGAASAGGGLPPPPHLGAVGRELWAAVTAEYELTDPASVEVLAQACMARERAAKCAAIIERDGELTDRPARQVAPAAAG